MVRRIAQHTLFLKKDFYSRMYRLVCMANVCFIGLSDLVLMT